MTDWLRRRSERLYRWLLAAYPREFREAYGEEMTRTFRDLLRDETPDIAALVRLWRRTLADLVRTAFNERLEAMDKDRSWLLVTVGVAVGAAITWVDTRPTWDDTGISAGVVFLAAAALGAANPRHPWRWALAVGAWIPLFGILLHANYESVLALLVALAGAYGGAWIRRCLSGLPGPA